jgi:hypothetical protein
MIPRNTENTITSILANELVRLGIEAASFRSLETPEGRREIDILCQHDGYYPIEAKFSERDLVSAIAKIQNDYLKHHKILGMKGGFALLYPEKLTRPLNLKQINELAEVESFKVIMMFLPEDPRGFSVFEGNLFEAAKEIGRQIVEQPEYVEPSINYIIKALRETAFTIATGLSHLQGIQLEDLFGGKGVFENILQYEEREYPEESLRLASGYILINQLLFYQVLSKRNPSKFPEIDINEIKTPSDLNLYFNLVIEVNYRVIYQYNVVQRIPRRSTTDIQTIITVIQGLAPEKVGGDLLGTIFHDLVPFEVRKRVAAFYTNVLAAELLSCLSISKWNARVADFACGSGGLLVAAYRRKKYLKERKSSFSQKNHIQFVEEDLLGIDVMPFAANVAACHLALQSPEYFTNKVRVAVWDSTELDPKKRKNIPSVASTHYVLKGQLTFESFSEDTDSKGVVSLTGEIPEEIPLEPYDVVIMNPPFTRQERIPEDYKEMLSTRFSDYQEYLHGQLGYHGYFLFLADRFLLANGRIALVLPATVLRIKSFEGVRNFLAKNYHIEHIIITSQRSAFSESVMFREMLLVAKKKKSESNIKTKITNLKKIPTSMIRARNLANEIKKAKSDCENNIMKLNLLDYSDLQSNIDNWFEYILEESYINEIFQELELSEKTVALKELGYQIIRGVETARGGKIQALTIAREDRAIKSEDEWIIKKIFSDSILTENRFTKMRLNIDKESLIPALRRVALVNSIDLTCNSDYVIKDTFSTEDEFFRRSISEFKPTGNFWEKWNNYVEARSCNLAVIRRADISAPGTCLLSFYSKNIFTPPGLGWAIKCSEEEAKYLALWFNSTLNLLVPSSYWLTFLLRHLDNYESSLIFIEVPLQ